MAVFIFIFLIWLIVLQVTVNRLEEQIKTINALQHSLDSSTQQPVTPPTAQMNPQHTSPVMPASIPSQRTSKVEEESSSGQTALSTNSPKNPPSHTPASVPVSKPMFEITAAKLFSWIGGFMLFLGCVWGIKYIVENNLLSPALRIVLSTGAGIVLTGCGYAIKNAKYRVTSHTLLGSGVAIIYTAIYCAHAFYHFISLGTTFVLLAATSFATFALSLNKGAKYVGYLGTIIAFLTPLLLNSGKDAWIVFFSYVFCINATAAYSAVKKGWNDLFICTLGFTWLCQAAWLSPFASYKLAGIASFFSLYALAGAWLIRHEQAAAVIARTVGCFLCMELLLMTGIGASLGEPLPGSLLLLSHVFLVNLIILTLAGRGNLDLAFARAGKVLSFLVLFIWLLAHAPQAPLWLSLGACMLFAALNSSVELLPIFGRRSVKSLDILSLIYPLLVMGALLIVGLVRGPVSALSFISIFTVLGILLIVTIVAAVLAHLMWLAFVAVGLLFVFLITSVIFGSGGFYFAPCLLLSGLIPVLLCMGALLTLHRMQRTASPVNGEKLLAAVTALLPFVLILTVTQAQHTPHIHWIFATTCAVCLLNVLAARLYKNTFILPAAALGTGLVLLAMWQGVSNWQTAVLFGNWMIILLTLFVLVPFLSKQHFWFQEGPWIACTITGVETCVLACVLAHQYLPSFHTGWIPAILLGLYTYLLYKLWPTARTAQAQPLSVACISGAVLFFLTLISPLEIHNYWLAVAWMAQAVLLGILNIRLPYRAWKIVSAGLAVIVVCLLLSMNFSPIPTLRIWNWYLWVYGLCAAAFFLLARMWEKPSRWAIVFNVCCWAALFYLLNIEIAHWFNTTDVLEFNYTGRLAESLTYTLSWALFGIGSIGLGLKVQKSALSKAGIGIMALALLKFFCLDIWQLEALYRILGAFGLAVLLITSSYWYQKKQKIR